MDSMLPVATVSDLQRSTKDVFDSLRDYIVIQNHGKDVGLLLHPDLGRVLLQSDAFRQLLEQCSPSHESSLPTDGPVDFRELDGLIGQVLRELSKK